MTTQDTLPKLLKQNYAHYGTNSIAMRKKEFGIWQNYTWHDYYQTVKAFSLGLIRLGLEPGDKVAIIGDNDLQWYWAELGIQAARGISVGLFADQVVSEIQYILTHSEAKFVVAEDQEQIDKILSFRENLPLLEKVIYWDSKGLHSYNDPGLLNFADVLNMGNDYEAAHPGLFEENVTQATGEEIAFIIYTSGTTGLPKGALRTHASLIHSVEGLLNSNPVDDSYEYVSTMPLAWIPEQMFGVAQSLLCGMKVNFTEEPETAQTDMREIGASWMFLGPRLWEDLASKLRRDIDETTVIKRLMYQLMLPIGYKMGDMKYNRQQTSLFWKLLYHLARLTVFRPAKDLLGLSQTRCSYTAGHVISPDLCKFFHALGVNIKQLYGQTEGGIPAAHSDDNIELDTIGPPLWGTQIRISNEGEILVSGSGIFQGYYKDPELTRETLEGTWVHSGDAGYIREDGHLVLWDRKKYLVELAGGVKFVPGYMEALLKFNPYIRDVLLVGGKERDYITAVINIDFDNIARWAERKHLVYTTFPDLSQKPEVYELIQSGVEKANRFLPEAARIKKFVNLHKEFDADEAELTRTRKLRREVVEERYKGLLNAMYENKSEFTVEAEVRYRDGRKGTTMTALKIRAL